MADAPQVCYAITYGEYSSYFVAAIYTDKTLFDGYVEMCRAAGSEPQTEEILLNPHADVIRHRIPSWNVTMDWDGNNAVAQPAGPTDEVEPRWMPAHRPFSEREQWSMMLPAKDGATAIKALNERRLMLIAEGCPREWDAYFTWLKATGRST
jgi:hypothetical protein